MNPRKIPGQRAPQTIDRLLENWDAAQWSVACREMQIRIAHGSYQGAHAVLDRFIQATRPKFATLDSQVIDVFDIKLASMLEQEGFKTIRVLDRISDDRLRMIRSLGPKQVQYIRQAIIEVKKGIRPEIAPDGNLIDLIDEEHCYTPESLNRNSAKQSLLTA